MLFAWTVGWPGILCGQGYRVRLDSRVRSATYRGVEFDSIVATDVVAGQVGGLLTPDGFAVRCRSGQVFCTYYRPGNNLRSQPLITTADVAIWGIGVPGVSFRTKQRFGVDLSDARVFNGSNPNLQMLSGFFDYTKPGLNLQLGRTHVTTRFGFTGFDGARLNKKTLGDVVDLDVYAGLGLARGIAVPINNSAVSPLDEFQPRKRHLVAGGSLGLVDGPAKLRMMYEREVDRGTDQLISERVGFSGSFNVLPQLIVRGGGDYDIAAGWFGSGEMTASVATRSLSGSLGLIRYRPHFDLWTIWGAFSPVPYHAANASISVRPLGDLEIHGRAEIYEFADDEADTPLSDFEEDGWRVGVGGRVNTTAITTVSLDYHAEFGPGASSQGLNGAVELRNGQGFSVTGAGGVLSRPLEFRFGDAKVWFYSLKADFELPSGAVLDISAGRYSETRRRPDAGEFDWNQWRVDAGLRLFFGSGIDERGLHPAILQVPVRGGGL